MATRTEPAGVLHVGLTVGNPTTDWVQLPSAAALRVYLSSTAAALLTVQVSLDGGVTWGPAATVVLASSGIESAELARPVGLIRGFLAVATQPATVEWQAAW